MAIGTYSNNPTPPPVQPLPAPPNGYEQQVEDQLRKTRLQVKVVEIVTSTLLLIAGALGFLLALAVVDHWLFAMGFWSRLLALLMLLGGAGWWFAIRILPLIIRRINPVYAAHTIERAEPSLKNSLINFLLLRSRRGQVHDVVYNALGQRAASDLAHVPADNAVDHSNLIRLGYVLAALLAVGAAYKILSPKDPLQSVARVMAPWADIEKPSRVQIEDIRPLDVSIFQGEAVEVSASVRGAGSRDDVQLVYSTLDGQVVEESLTMQLDSATSRHAAMLGGERGVQTSLQYKIVAGDAQTRWHNVELLPAPHILVTKVQYEPPAYTGRETDYSPRGDISALEGTKVTIFARANRDVESAYLEFDPVIGPDGRPAASDDSSNSIRIRNIDGQEVEVSFYLRLNEDRKTPWHSKYCLTFKGRDGHQNLKPVVHTIDVKPDLAPLVEILSPAERTIQVPLNGKAEIEVRAIDHDFALARVRLVGIRDGKDVLNEPLLESADGRVGQVIQKFEFQPEKHELAVGDVVEYWAVAEDNRTAVKTQSPEPNVTRSRPNYKIEVIAAEERRGGEKSPDEKGGEGDAGEESQDGGEGSSGTPQAGQEGNSNQGGNSGEDNQSGEDQSGEDQSGEGQSGEGQQNNEGGSESSGQTGGDNGQAGNQQGSSNNSDSDGSGSQGGQSGSSGNNSGTKNGESGQSGNNSGESGSQNGQQSDGQQDGGQQNGGQQGSNGQSGGNQNSGQNSQGGNRGQQGADQTASREPLANDGSQDGDVFDRLNKLRQQAAQNREGQNQQGQNQNAQNGGGQDQQQGGNQQAENGNQQNQGAQGQQPGQNNAGDSQSGGNSGNQQGQKPEQGQEGNQQNGGAQGSQQKQNGASGQEQNGNQSGGAQQQQNQNQNGSAASQQNNSGGGNNQNQQENAGGNQSQGGQPQGGQKPDGQEQQGGGEGGQQPMSGGQGDNDKSGAGQKTDGGGSPQSQAENPQQRNQQQSGGGGSSASQKDDGGKSPSGNNQGSQSQGESAGDRKGGGQQGGGQSSQQPGQDSAGSGSSGEQGDGAAKDPGAGQSGNRGGGDQIANSPTGRSGEQTGEGSNTGDSSGGQQQGGSRQGDSQQSEGSQSKNSGEGQPANGSPDSQDPSGQRSNTPGDGRGRPLGGGRPGERIPPPQRGPRVDPTSDKANLEYARKSTDLLLEYLKDHKDNPELLDELNWTQDDVDKFIQRWHRQNEAARKAGEDSEESRRLDDSLRSLGLRPPREAARSGEAGDRTLTGERDAGTRTRPPKEYEEQFRAFSKFITP